MFSLFRRRAQRELPAEYSLGALTLHTGGSYSIGPLRFDQSCSIQDSQFGDVTVNKRQGVGQELRIEGENGHVYRFLFDGSAWSARH
jgi:hypothetical protein